MHSVNVSADSHQWLVLGLVSDAYPTDTAICLDFGSVRVDPAYFHDANLCAPLYDLDAGRL